MPNWKPGIQNGQPVKAYIHLPCTFKLGTEDDDEENQEAKFVGGESAYQKFLKKNFEYPKDARKNGIEGIVVLIFTVNENGKASDVKVSKSLSASCDQEALRLFSLIPTWSPQKKEGKPVAGEGSMTVAFRRKFFNETSAIELFFHEIVISQFTITSTRTHSGLRDKVCSAIIVSPIFEYLNFQP